MSASVRQPNEASARLIRRVHAGNESTRSPRGQNSDAVDEKKVKQNGRSADPAAYEEQPGKPDTRQSASAAKKMAKPPIVKPLDITVPDEIDRYTIGRRIGSGTCGVVHHALDNLLGREVAIKLSPIGEAHISTGKVPGAQRAYQTEIIAAGRLTHPNIVTIHDAGQFEELNYLVMESVEGETLKEFGKGKKLLPVGEALRVICECCKALDYSHAQGILHRDIKPANIMLAADGSVKILDFGIAVGLDKSGALKKKGPTLGTPNYMSPEQILGRELGPQSDFYSLATVLFEMLTGRQLFKAKKVKDLFRTVVHQTAPRLTAIRPDMPRGLSDVLAKALAKKPDIRFRSGDELIRALAPYLEGFRAVETRPPAQQRLIKLLRKQAFFKVFSEVEIALLLERVKVRTYEPGETLIAKGEGDRRLLVLTDGVSVCYRNNSYHSVLITGECLGESGFINGVGDNCSHRSLTSVSALEFTANALAELPPKVHLHYYRHISDIMVARLAEVDQVAVVYPL
ncbi:MAG: protein kinase [Granulosicoccus sp.]|nr:protein kinase [Granulosicoccus sp.]